jgi:hypothetical protein
MRRLVATTSLTATVVAFAGAATLLAAEKPKIPSSVKSKVAKAVAELVNGEVAPDDTNQREQIFVEIDKNLAKDKKNAALKTPDFWVESIQSGFFSSSKGHKSARAKQIVEDKMAVQYADESVGEVPIFFRGGNAYQAKNSHTLVVTVLPKGTDAKAWLTENWAANEVAAKDWIVAAVVISDKMPLDDQPFLLAHAFGHMMFSFNTNANKWYLEGVGDACAAAQKAACENMPDRLAGLILRNPSSAVTNANSKMFSTYVIDEGAAADVGKAYSEMDAERNVVAAAGETAVADLVTWIGAHEGRTLPASYDFVTATNEKRIVAPWTGSVFLVSPAKRGETTEFKVTYDMDANSVDLSGSNLGEFVVYMNDDLLDLDKPVKVTCNGSELVVKQFERNLKAIFETADTFGEYGRVFTAEFRGFAPTEVASDGGEDGGEAGAGEAE